LVILGIGNVKSMIKGLNESLTKELCLLLSFETPGADHILRSMPVKQREAWGWDGRTHLMKKNTKNPEWWVFPTGTYHYSRKVPDTA